MTESDLPEALQRWISDPAAEGLDYHFILPQGRYGVLGEVCVEVRQDGAVHVYSKEGKASAAEPGNGAVQVVTLQLSLLQNLATESARLACFASFVSHAGCEQPWTEAGGWQGSSDPSYLVNQIRQTADELQARLYKLFDKEKP